MVDRTDEASDRPRATMFVYNTVHRDRRVLKEAASLVASGWSVTVIGISLPRDPRQHREVLPTGVEILRVPLSLAPPVWRRVGYLRGIIRRWHRRRVAFRARLDRLRSRPIRWSHPVARSIARRANRGWVRQVARLARPRRFRRLSRWLRQQMALSGRRRSERREIVADHRPPFARRFAGAIGHAAAVAWLGGYAGVNRLTDGELDWYLNARQRWRQFDESAAVLAPPSDVYHGHDLSGIGAAVKARDRQAAGSVVYDAHELYVESGTLATRSAVLKALLRRMERKAYRRADEVIVVNPGIGAELSAHYGARRLTVVQNCVEPLPLGRYPDLRRAIGVEPDVPVALYQGVLAEVRGMRQLLAAMVAVGMEDIHLALLGFGPMEDELRAYATSGPLFGRLHVLTPVPHDALDRWISGADVCLMTNLPAGRNEVLSTPNKLFESLAAGVPVVTSDFPQRRAIVIEDPLGPLGAVCDPTDPASISDAIKGIVHADPRERAAMRARCRQAAAERWNWAHEERRLHALYERVGPRHAMLAATRMLGRQGN